MTGQTHTLKQRLLGSDEFLIGVELVTTRGTMEQASASRARKFATELTRCPRVDWVSITDNAGGNPMLSPMALGKPILYGGKEVVIHLSCKDFNRHAIESAAWELASEGFHNILSLSGDYPAGGYRGQAKPVFDIDSVGLLTLLNEMNQGMGNRPKANGAKPAADAKESNGTDFFSGAVTTNVKLHENEVMPQYLKLEKKIECGAEFIIAQIGYDSRKCHEQIAYLEKRGHGQVPLIGNVFVLTLPVARFFRTGKIPGVVVSDALIEQCEKYGKGEDKGRKFFRELAAKQIAIFRGLGYRGAYLGGLHHYKGIQNVLDISETFGDDDWKQFAKEIRFSRPGEFFLYDQDPDTGLANPEKLNPDYEASLTSRKATKNVTMGYRLSKMTHSAIFTPGKPLFKAGAKIYAKSKNDKQGPIALRVLEHASKAAMFHCKDCGDCSLPDIAYLCPESQCAKNQRNGPCGGTRDGICEVFDFECIWAKAYDRLKWEGKDQDLLAHAPVIQDQAMRGTSSWANTFLQRDHHSKQTTSIKTEK